MEERVFTHMDSQYIKIQKPEKPEMNFNAVDIVFSFAALVLGFLYWNLIHFYSLGAGVTIFTFVLCAASVIYLSKSGIKQNAKSLTCLALLAFSAVQFTLFDNQFISGLNFIFLTVTFIYWICLSTGRQIDKKLSVYIMGDAIKQGINIPFLNFGCCMMGIKKGFSKQKKGKGILAAFIGVLVFLPIIAAVIHLLMSADLAFENFIIRFSDMLSVEKFITYIWQFILGIPVAFYLYGLIYGDVKGRYDDRITSDSVDNAAKIIRIAPKITIYSALTSFNIVYLIFFAVQAAYLFSAFNGNLPETFTYAEYARRGFFEICAVAGINLGVLIITHLTIKKETDEEPKVLRMETVMISLFTILLIVTALSKMIMYINVYGLTQLRVFTSWFMILLLFIFAITCARQFKKFNSARLIIAGFVLLFMVLSYGNVDGVIAKYNIERYEAGTLSALDIDALHDLSAAAVPYVYDLYLKTDESDFEMREKLAYVIANGRTYEETGFRDFNFQRYRADELTLRRH